MSWNKRVLFLGIAWLLTLGTALADDCKPVNGHLRSEGFTSGCPSPIGLCTAGRLNGGVQGDFVFVATSFFPAGPSNPPMIFFYTGTITVTSDRGALTCTDAGAFNVVNGAVVDLCTISGGTGKYAGATGEIKIFGVFVNNEGDSDYRGEICKP